MNPPGFNENSCANNKEPEFGSQILDPERYKTELCRTFERDGFCGYGAKCQFAHSNRELRSPSRNSKYKTEPCRAFHIIGYCPYGTRCQYVHRASADNGASSPSSSRASNAKKSSSPPLSHAEMAERYGLAHVPGTFDTFECGDCGLTFSGYKRRDPRLLEHAVGGSGRCRYVKAVFREHGADLASVVHDTRFERGLVAFPFEPIEGGISGCRVCASPTEREHYPGCAETVSAVENFLKNTQLLRPPLRPEFLFAWSGADAPEGGSFTTGKLSSLWDPANMVHVPETWDCHRCDSCGIDVGALVTGDTLLGEHVYHVYNRGLRCSYLEERFGGERAKMMIILGRERFRKGYLAFPEAFARFCRNRNPWAETPGVATRCLICGADRRKGHESRCEEMGEELRKRLDTEILLP